MKGNITQVCGHYNLLGCAPICIKEIITLTGYVTNGQGNKCTKSSVDLCTIGFNQEIHIQILFNQSKMGGTSNDNIEYQAIGLPHDIWISWKRKRRHTLIGCIIIGLTIGIDCSICISTLLYYLRDLVKTKNPNLWYGAIIACFFVSSTIFGAISGRWLDRTRQVRMYVGLTLLFQAVGFLIYTIPYHPLWLLLGRVICGIGDCFPSVITGELFRIYTDEESTRAVLWLHSVYSFGFIIGPAFNLFFSGLSFHIGSFEINNLNIVGIFMAGLSLLALFASHFLVHNCSSILDLKASNEKDKFLSKATECFDVSSASKATVISQTAIDDVGVKNEICDVEDDEPVDADVISKDLSKLDELPGDVVNNRNTQITSEKKHDDVSSNGSSNQQNKESTPSILSIFRKLLKNKESALIFISSFLLMYTMSSATYVLPLVVAQTLEWKETTLSIITFAEGGLDILVLLVIGKFCTTNRIVYFTSIICISCQLVTCVTLFLFKMLPRDWTRDIGLIGIFAVTSTIGWCFDDVIIRVMFGNMIPSEIQSFAETLRTGVSKIAIISATLTVGIMFPSLHWWSSCILVLIFITMMGFVVRWKFLIDPKEIEFQ